VASEATPRAFGVQESPLRALHAVARAIAQHLDLGILLDHAIRELDHALPQLPSAVWLSEDEGGCAHYDLADDIVGTTVQRWPAADSAWGSVRFKLEAASAGPETAALGLVPGLRLPLRETPFAACWQDGQPLHIDWSHADAHSDSLTQSLARSGITSCQVVPLRAGPRTVGLLQNLCLGTVSVSDDQQHFLGLVADLLGPAVCKCQEHARLRAAWQELGLPLDQRVQAEKMRALSDMAGGMAHDFNNALCGVLGFLELALLDEGLGNRSQGFLESARTCVFDAVETVRRVQAFARRRRYELSVQLLDLNEVVQQTLELIRPGWEGLGRAADALLHVDVRTEATAWVRGRPAELREVLTNLALNAVEAMPGGGTLTIQTWSTADHTFLAVADTGSGMTDDVRRRLFEPFFTTRGERRRGLGLSVVFGIVHRHGGEITVATEPGRGSRFAIGLPAAGDGPAAS
jgi:signal transduction histidine kinase